MKIATKSIIDQQNAMFLKAVQAFIPGVDASNIARVAHRFSLGTEDRIPYPKYLYLDHGTEFEQLIMIIDEPTTEYDFVKGQARFKQNYRVPFSDYTPPKPDPILIDLSGHQISTLAVVHYEIDEYHWINGTVYAAHGHDCYPGSEESEWEYQCADSCDTTDDREKAKVLFTFKFCWRGVWEGRVYFPNDEEYWCEELAELATIWRKLEPELKELIKSINSNARDD